MDNTSSTRPFSFLPFEKQMYSESIFVFLKEVIADIFTDFKTQRAFSMIITYRGAINLLCCCHLVCRLPITLRTRYPSETHSICFQGYCFDCCCAVCMANILTSFALLLAWSGLLFGINNAHLKNCLKISWKCSLRQAYAGKYFN